MYEDFLPQVNEAGSDRDLVRQKDSERDSPPHRLGHQSRLMESLSSITFSSCPLLLQMEMLSEMLSVAVGFALFSSHRCLRGLWHL